MKRFLLLMGAVLFISGTAFGQTTLFFQDFEAGSDDWNFTLDPATFNTSGDIWAIVTSLGSISPTSGSNFFGVQDLESTPGTGSGEFGVISFDYVDVSGESNVEISFDYDIDGFDSNDDVWYVVYEDETQADSTQLIDGFSNFSDDGTVTYSVGAADSVKLLVYVRQNGGSDQGGFDNFKITSSALKAEPTNHPTSFTATTDGFSEIDLSWTDATGAVVPDGYLIKVSETSLATIADPVDGTVESDDTDASDGSGILNVSNGTQVASFTGLDDNTQYFFKIYSYTNSGANIDYKVDGTIQSDDTTTDDAPDIVLNEILADPGASDGDANGDGSIDTSDDEFVEFVNTGSSDLDISDWTISDGFGLRHTFASSTILKSNQAVVVFGAGTPTGDFGDALVFVASSNSLGLNNGGDDVILKDDSDNTIISVTYSGATDQSETRSPDLTGAFADHETADTDDSSPYSPGTKIDGTTFQTQVELTGTEGWRLISTPVSGETFDDVIDDLWTQGFTGADSPSNGTSNVYEYDETVTTGDLDDGYQSISNQSNTMSDGTGYAVYVYEDDDFSTGGTQGGFPKSLSVFGDSPSANVGPVSFTFTSSGNAANDGWNLTGNPFGSTLNVDDLGFNSDSDIDDFAYVYRSGSFSALDAGGSSGETINVGEGFFVKVDAAVNYTFPIAAAPSKATPKESYAVRFELSDADMRSKASVRFHEDADFGKDGKDAYYIRSLESTYFGLFSRDEGNEFSVNSYPLDFEGTLTTPLVISGNKSGMITLSWGTPEGLDKGWSYELVDNTTDQRYDLTNEGSLEFNYDGEETKRFSLISVTGTTVTTEPASGVTGFALEQNYPNPFNPTTTINYSVENSGAVTLSVYNLMGQKVAELVNETKAAGSYNVTWNASQAASGMYYYRLEAGGQVLTRKMTLIK